MQRLKKDRFKGCNSSYQAIKGIDPNGWYAIATSPFRLFGVTHSAGDLLHQHTRGTNRHLVGPLMPRRWIARESSVAHDKAQKWIRIAKAPAVVISGKDATKQGYGTPTVSAMSIETQEENEQLEPIVKKRPWNKSEPLLGEVAIEELDAALLVDAQNNALNMLLGLMGDSAAKDNVDMLSPLERVGLQVVRAVMAARS
jgi:hypothetical protein